MSEGEYLIVGLLFFLIGRQILDDGALWAALGAGVVGFFSICASILIGITRLFP